MTLDLQMRSVFRQARSDRVLLIYLAALVALHTPYFLPIFTEDQLYNWNWGISSLFLLPSLSLLLWPFAKAGIPKTERAFWKVLSVAFMFWWAGGLLNWLLPYEAWSIPLSIAADSIYLGYYLCWMGAINLVFRQEHKQTALRSGRWLHASALIALAFWLFAYFFLIPSQFMPDAYETWVPSLLFYAALDLALAVLFLRLALISKSARWTALFGLMMIASLAYCIMDVLESLTVIYDIAWAQSMKSSVLWSIPFPLVALFARARHYSFPKTPTVLGDENIFKTTGSEYSSPIILIAFLPPIIHLTLGQLNLLNEEMRLVQDAVVLASLVVFLVLAILENRYLRKVTHTALHQEKELARLRFHQQVADEVQKVKGRFLANISHEIRTPLSGVLGMVELQLLDEQDPDRRRRFELIRDSAKNLTGIIDDILEYTDVESGYMRVSHEPFQLDEVVIQVHEMFESAAREKGLALTFEIARGMPTKLIGDASRLRQILTALVANGIKFTEKGEVGIEFSSTQPDPMTSIIHCNVTDTGIGFDEAQVSTLFLPFSQADNSTTRKFGGSGLGLAISKQIVDAQCGEIGAHSNPEGGSTFWFKIPFAVAEMPESESDDPDSEPAPPKQRILLAEDERTCQLVTAKQLECLGFEVDIVQDGREAIKAARRRQYDLILMDARMPVLDGLEATRQIRALDPPQCHVPVIALTAFALEEDREACQKAGMNDFLVKPATLKSLKLILSKWLPIDSDQQTATTEPTNTTT